MMYAIGIIPENTEIRCGRFQSGKFLHHFSGIGNTRRIAILRYAPYSLDKRIVFHILADQVHVRAVLQQRNVDLLDPEVFGHGEVPVITRDRTQEFDMSLLDPRRIPHDTMLHRA